MRKGYPISIFRRLTNLFILSKVEREIDAELRSHIELRIEDNIAAGMSVQEGNAPRGSASVAALPLKRAATQSAYCVGARSSLGMPTTTIFNVKATASKAAAHAVDFDLIATTDSTGEAVKKLCIAL
jgi:hypothetical protein